jgi:hypothetical protein
MVYTCAREWAKWWLCAGALRLGSIPHRSYMCAMESSCVVVGRVIASNIGKTLHHFAMIWEPHSACPR